MKFFPSLIIISIIFILCHTIFIEPNLINITYYKINDKNLKGLRALSIADIHPRPNQEKRVAEIVDKANSLEPDLIFLLGDYVAEYNPEQSLPIEITAKHLSQLHGNLGTYAVLGNHDWWQNETKIKNELKKNYITVFENQSIHIITDNQNFYIAGLDDIETGNPDINKALGKTKEPTILLTHNPDIFPKIPETVSLTLSGHTHGGQIVIPGIGPLVVPSNYGKKYAYGLKEENHKKIVISKGLGTSILPIRFNCAPEIVVIDFI